MIPTLRPYVIILALVAGLSLSLWLAYSTSKALTLVEDRADALEARLEAAEARIGRVQAQANQAAKKAQEARNALDQAIAKDPADAAERTPPAVVDSLCGKLRCTGQPR